MLACLLAFTEPMALDLPTHICTRCLELAHVSDRSKGADTMADGRSKDVRVGRAYVRKLKPYLLSPHGPVRFKNVPCRRPTHATLVVARQQPVQLLCADAQPVRPVCSC